MPHIVDEGRRVINNIQRAASLFLVKTTFSTILSILTLFFMSRYPFEPIQLTLISSCTIGIPSFFLALEANHARVEGNFLINVLGVPFPERVCRTQYPLCQYILFVFSNDAGGYVHHVCITDRYQLPDRSVSGVYAVYQKASADLLQHDRTLCCMHRLFTSIFSLVRLSYMQFVLTGAGMAAIPFVMDFFFRFGNRFKLKVTAA